MKCNKYICFDQVVWHDSFAVFRSLPDDCSHRRMLQKVPVFPSYVSNEFCLTLSTMFKHLEHVVDNIW